MPIPSMLLVGDRLVTPADNEPSNKIKRLILSACSNCTIECVSKFPELDSRFDLKDEPRVRETRGRFLMHPEIQPLKD
jgi:hypothetical protein